ncbi:hypothetical protein OAC51_03875 [Flavobacteriaceae bacterium]|nr:hypothetical protein [Flavobacteriaceae bacterium]
MKKYEIVRCLEESPQVMGLNLKAAVFSVLIILLSVFLLMKSVFSLGLNILVVIIIKIDKRFGKKGSFEMYVDKISRAKKTYVFDFNPADLIKK